LTTARGAMSADRTRSVNALNALVRSNNLGVDARKSLTASQISDISRWRPREEELSLSVARAEAIRLAKRILELDEQLTANEKQLDELARPRPCWKRKASGRSAPQSVSPHGHTKAGFVTRRLSPHWPG
jgi:hypothetical protein